MLGGKVQQRWSGLCYVLKLLLSYILLSVALAYFDVEV